MKKKTIIKIIVGIIVLVGAIWGIRYALEEYDKAQAALGIVICDHDKQECQKSMHIHSDVVFDLCGQSLVLPRETGPLDGLHTHKEPNYLHFHDSVDLDYETREDLPDERLSIREIIRVFELDQKTYCGEGNVGVKVLVNGLEPAEKLDYNWKDGDDIELIYFDGESGH